MSEGGGIADNPKEYCRNASSAQSAIFANFWGEGREEQEALALLSKTRGEGGVYRESAKN